MDFSCGLCNNEWICSWCKNTHCDDVQSPYKLEGKPMPSKNIDEIPKQTIFCLCQECKEKYIEKNIRKGRYEHKIGRKETTI